MHFMLLAEQSTMSDGMLGGMVGAVGSVGFAIWYGWFVTTRTIPKLVSDFRAERTLDRNELASQRAISMDLARSGHDALNQVTRAVERLTDHVQRVTTCTEKP